MLRDLVYGWGNTGWSALDEYLAACIAHALNTEGSILECGSGLSTLLVGVIAERRGLRLRALEHNPRWAVRVQHELDHYGLGAVNIETKPLRDYGEFDWYDPSESAFDGRYALVICDGPPGDTRGGRAGLVPVMRDCLASPVTILLDDAWREAEVGIARQWRDELGSTLEVLGDRKPYVKLTAPM